MSDATKLAREALGNLMTLARPFHRDTDSIWVAMLKQYDEALADLATAPGESEGAEPVAWVYQIAHAKSGGEYCAWIDKVSSFKPRVPEGSIRNLRPLYAYPPAAPAGEAGMREAMRLRGIIQNVLDGNYPNPRDHRPSTCKHGTGYYDACEQCLDEYLRAALAQETSNG